MDLISVVVPVYNVEKYLDRCVNSIIDQTYKNLEIILVDDGSPDNCGTMCDEWAAKDDRIKVVHKENAGLGYARNSGIDVACGKYIMFVDSDDYIAHDTCEKSINYVKKHNAQACFFGHTYDCGGIIVDNFYYPDKLVYQDDEVVDLFLADSIAPKSTTTKNPYIGMSAWCTFCELKIINDNNIRFKSERDYLNEDLFFRVELCKYIKKVAILPDALYCYCFNEVSLSNSYRKDRFEASLRMYNKLTENLRDFLERKDIADRSRRAFMINLLVCLKQEIFCLKKLGIKALLKNYAKIVHHPIVQDVLGGYPIKNMPIKQRLLFTVLKNKNIIILFLFVYFKCRERR